MKPTIPLSTLLAWRDLSPAEIERKFRAALDAIRREHWRLSDEDCWARRERVAPDRDEEI